jgi:hypothetical protein
MTGPAQTDKDFRHYKTIVRAGRPSEKKKYLRVALIHFFYIRVVNDNTVSSLPVNLLIPYSRVLLEKLTGYQLVNKFPVFYGTRRLITAFTHARHLSLS